MAEAVAADRTPGRDGPSNAAIAALLTEIADLLEIRGESAFRVGAYRRAAESVGRCPLDVAAEVRAGHPLEVPGVGQTIAERISELVESGRIAYLDELRHEVPPTLLPLLAIPGVGPRTVGTAWRELGIATPEDFAAAARAGRLRELPGFGPRTEARILEGIEQLTRGPRRRMRIGEAQALAARVIEVMEALPGVRSATACGSLRRRCETVGDLDVLIETDQPEAALAALATLPSADPEAADLPVAGHARLSLGLRDGPRLDVMTTPPGSVGSALVHFTGSAAHNVALRHRARQMGWSLSEHGLAALGGEGGEVRTFATEAALYAALGLSDDPTGAARGTG